MTTGVKSVRVNLRFGKQTDATLLSAVVALNPYARAKFIRKLALDGWRLRRGEQGTVVQREPVPFSAHDLPDVPASQFSDSVLSLIGKNVRLQEDAES